jgi:hypothetical protein
MSSFLRAINRRPLNVCSSCGYTWYPRGKNLSLKCPNCGASTTQAGNSGCGSVLVALGILAVIPIMALICCGGLGALTSLIGEGKPLASDPTAKPGKGEGNTPPINSQLPHDVENSALTSGESNGAASAGGELETKSSAGTPSQGVETPLEVEASNAPPEFAGELVQDNATLGPLREWSSADGQFHRKARYRSLVGKHVKLIREDGTKIDVELSRLSQIDRDWLDAYLQWKRYGRKPLKQNAKSNNGD